MTDEPTAYDEKKARELAWYAPQPRRSFFVNYVLRHRLIFSYPRIVFNYIFPKQQMASVVRRMAGCVRVRVLNAPCGRGNDFKYLNIPGASVYGIDLSPQATAVCPKPLRSVVGDILALPYADGTFDLVVAPLFFHHMLQFGFFPFLQEFHRVLRGGGKVIILEPSLLYPLNLVTRPIKALFNNPYDEVEDEGPFPPGQMLVALNEAGFINTGAQAATFSHPAFYVPVARLVNHLTAFLLERWPFKYFGWLVIFWGEKPVVQSVPLQ